jgi:PEP-CTERM motif
MKRRFYIFPILIGLTATSASAQSLAGIVRSLSVQVPEPGMLMLFGAGAAVLGLRMGRKK